MLLTVGICLASGLGISQAHGHANPLDGNWCNGDKRLILRGMEVTTPSGMTFEGAVSPRQFSYMAPPGDWNAGKNIQLRLRWRDRLMVSIGGGKPTLWKPCLDLS